MPPNNTPGDVRSDNIRSLIESMSQHNGSGIVSGTLNSNPLNHATLVHAAEDLQLLGITELRGFPSARGVNPRSGERSLVFEAFGAKGEKLNMVVRFSPESRRTPASVNIMQPFLEVSVPNINAPLFMDVCALGDEVKPALLRDPVGGNVRALKKEGFFGYNRARTDGGSDLASPDNHKIFNGKIKLVDTGELRSNSTTPGSASDTGYRPGDWRGTDEFKQLTPAGQQSKVFDPAIIQQLRQRELEQNAQFVALQQQDRVVLADAKALFQSTGKTPYQILGLDIDEMTGQPFDPKQFGLSAMRDMSPEYITRRIEEVHVQYPNPESVPPDVQAASAVLSVPRLRAQYHSVPLSLLARPFETTPDQYDVQETFARGQQRLVESAARAGQAPAAAKLNRDGTGPQYQFLPTEEQASNPRNADNGYANRGAMALDPSGDSSLDRARARRTARPTGEISPADIASVHRDNIPSAPVLAVPAAPQESPWVARSKMAGSVSTAQNASTILNATIGAMANADHLSPYEATLYSVQGGTAAAGILLEHAGDSKFTRTAGGRLGLAGSSIGVVTTSYELGKAVYAGDGTGIAVNSAGLSSSGLGVASAYASYIMQDAALAGKFAVGASAIATPVAVASLYMQGRQYASEAESLAGQHTSTENQRIVESKGAPARNYGGNLGLATPVSPSEYVQTPRFLQALENKNTEYERCVAVENTQYQQALVAAGNNQEEKTQADSAHRQTLEGLRQAYEPVDAAELSRLKIDPEALSKVAAHYASEYSAFTTARDQNQQTVDGLAFSSVAGRSISWVERKTIGEDGTKPFTDAITFQDKRAQLALVAAGTQTELNGTMRSADPAFSPEGMVARNGDYERILKPLEQQFPEQVNHLKALQQEHIDLGKTSVDEMGAVLGITGNPEKMDHLRSLSAAHLEKIQEFVDKRFQEKREDLDYKYRHDVYKYGEELAKLNAEQAQVKAIVQTGDMTNPAKLQGVVQRLGIENDPELKQQLFTLGQDSAKDLREHYAGEVVGKYFNSEQAVPAGNVTAFLEQNRKFIASYDERATAVAKPGLAQRKDISWVLSSDPVEYNRMERQYAPTRLVEQSKQEFADNTQALSTLTAQNDTLQARLSNLQTKTGYIPDTPEMTRDREAIDGTLYAEMGRLAKMQAGTNLQDPEAAARLENQRALVSGLQLDQAHFTSETLHSKIAIATKTADEKVVPDIERIEQRLATMPAFSDKDNPALKAPLEAYHTALQKFSNSSEQLERDTGAFTARFGDEAAQKAHTRANDPQYLEALNHIQELAFTTNLERSEALLAKEGLCKSYEQAADAVIAHEHTQQTSKWLETQNAENVLLKQSLPPEKLHEMQQAITTHLASTHSMVEYERQELAELQSQSAHATHRDQALDTRIAQSELTLVQMQSAYATLEHEDLQYYTKSLQPLAQHQADLAKVTGEAQNMSAENTRLTTQLRTAHVDVAALGEPASGMTQGDKVLTYSEAMDIQRKSLETAKQSLEGLKDPTAIRLQEDRIAASTLKLAQMENGLLTYQLETAQKQKVEAKIVSAPPAGKLSGYEHLPEELQREIAAIRNNSNKLACHPNPSTPAMPMTAMGDVARTQGGRPKG